MELKYIVYITVNTVNGKFYFGVHKTNPDLFDGYIGDGIYRQSMATKPNAFHKAVRKYGYENFKRTTICLFPNTEEGQKAAFDLETTLVNKTLLKSRNCYNTALGGHYNDNDCLKKRVYMFSLNGNFLRSFKSCRDAAVYVAPDNVESARRAIRNNCLGASSSSNGYFWSYKKDFNYVTSEKWRKIAQYTLNGKLVKIYDNITQAAVELQLNTIP